MYVLDFFIVGLYWMDCSLHSSSLCDYCVCTETLTMTLYLIYKTKYSEQSFNTIWDAIKTKLSACSLCWDPSDICTKMQTSCLNQMHQSERSFTAFVLMTHSSTWTVSESEHASLYCIYSILTATVIVISIFRAWLNKCFVYNEEDVLSYETCRIF